jgi:hypothetical protein
MWSHVFFQFKVLHVARRKGCSAVTCISHDFYQWYYHTHKIYQSMESHVLRSQPYPPCVLMLCPLDPSCLLSLACRLPRPHPQPPSQPVACCCIQLYGRHTGTFTQTYIYTDGMTIDTIAAARSSDPCAEDCLRTLVLPHNVKGSRRIKKDEKYDFHA